MKVRGDGLMDYSFRRLCRDPDEAPRAIPPASSSSPYRDDFQFGICFVYTLTKSLTCMRCPQVKTPRDGFMTDR